MDTQKNLQLPRGALVDRRTELGVTPGGASQWAKPFALCVCVRAGGVGVLKFAFPIFSGVMFSGAAGCALLVCVCYLAKQTCKCQFKRHKLRVLYPSLVSVCLFRP